MHQLIMFYFGNGFKLLVVGSWLCFDFIEATRKQEFQFVVDNDCYEMDNLEGEVLKSVRHTSNLECARTCAETPKCAYFQISSDASEKRMCVLLSFNNSTKQSQTPITPTTNSTQQPSTSATVCYKFANGNYGISNTASAESNCYDDMPKWTIDSPFPQCYRDLSPGLHKTKLLTVIDSNRPETQALHYITSLGNGWANSRTIFLDSHGIFHATVNSHGRIKSKYLLVVMIYAMEKNFQGFQQNADRIVNLFRNDGQLNTAFLHANGSSTLRRTKLSHMKIVVREHDDFTTKILRDNVNKSDVSKIVSLVEQGFDVKNYQDIEIMNNGSSVVFARTNDRIVLSNQGDFASPLTFQQVCCRFPFSCKYTYNIIGASGEITGSSYNALQNIRFNRKWKSITDPSLNASQQTAIIHRHISNGHQLRVSQDRTRYLAIHDAIKVGDIMFFALPQLSTVPPDHLNTEQNFIGIRAVLSSAGNYSWCSHPLEGEEVLDSGLLSGQNVGVFVDLIAWTPLLSVYSNGTVAFGNVSDLADATMAGSEMNVLIESTKYDWVRQISVLETTIKDFGQSDVLVSAESRITWHLIFGNEGLEMNSRCNMEKVLMQSNGKIEVLRYNVHQREASYHTLDVRSTWFVQSS